jgi:putative DNA-invertase from lambdoid prophage Rac
MRQERSLTSTKAAAWYRVSTDDQHTDNQVPDVEQFAAHHEYEIGRTFTVDDSAWKNGGGPEYRAALKAAMDAAWRGEFSVIIVWALDRITRNGAEDALRLVRQFRERGCTLLSVQEPWLNSSPEIVDVLIAFAGWQAQQESKRRSERIKAGQARRRADVAAGRITGHASGRKPGSKDRKKRSTAGYREGWAKRRAAEPRSS